MPSGAKKRKAAKKKENHPNTRLNPSSANSHTHDMVGDDDAKHQDSSDNGGDAVSSTSQDPQDNREHFTEGEDEEIDEGEKDSHLPSEEGVKNDVSVVSIIVTEDLGVPVEREFKIDDEPKNENGRLEHGNESHSSIGARDESNEVGILGEREFKIEDEAGKENGRFEHDDESPCSNGAEDECHGAEDECHGTKGSQVTGDAAPVDSEGTTDILSGGHVEEIDTIHESGYSVSKDIPEVVSQEITFLVEKVAESIHEENREKSPSSVKEKIYVSAAPEDAATVQEETYLQSVTTTPVPSSKEFVAIQTDDTSSLSYNATDNGADHDRDSSVTKQPLAPAPRAVQKTSWKNCCGLFEVFTGSDR